MTQETVFMQIMNKKLRTTLLLLLGAVTQMNAESLDGVYVWVSGSATCYQLSSMPTVTYSTDDSGNTVADLTLSGETTPVLSVPLTSGSSIEVVYGTYVYAKTNAYGFGTFSFNEPVQFPDDVKVYTATASGSTLTLTKTGNKIPAYNGVLLYGAPNTTYSLDVLTSADALDEDNELKPTTTETGLAATESCYVLSGNQFMKFEGTFTANKAYLPADVVANVKSFSFSFADDETGIANIPEVSPVHKNGKYISGGHLIIVKDGKKYDANGTLIK